MIKCGVCINKLRQERDTLQQQNTALVEQLKQANEDAERLCRECPASDRAGELAIQAHRARVGKGR